MGCQGGLGLGLCVRMRGANQPTCGDGFRQRIRSGRADNPEVSLAHNMSGFFSK
jgi:hypothetical protein